MILDRAVAKALPSRYLSGTFSFEKGLGHKCGDSFIKSRKLCEILPFDRRQIRALGSAQASSSLTCQLSKGVGTMHHASFQNIIDQIEPKCNLMEAFQSSASRHFIGNSYKNIWVGVHKDALLHNVDLIRNESPGKKFCAVMKCDAYGHGLDIVAPTIAHKVDSFAITENSEALVLRSMMSTQRKPIHRVRIADNFDISEALTKDLGIQELVGSYEQAMSLAMIANGLKGAPVEIHISLDCTGMGRDGFSTEAAQWPTTLQRIMGIAQNPMLKIVGISAHLPMSDTADFNQCNQVLKNFTTKAAFLKTRLPEADDIDIHALASAGSLRQGEVSAEVLQHISMNRAGAAIFGQSSHENQNIGAFRHAMSACTFVGDIFDRLPGNTVGYGSHYQVKNNLEKHANVAGGWNLFPREILKGQGNKNGIASIALINQSGGRHAVLGNPSMNSVICNATSTDDRQTLSRMDPLFYLADNHYLPQQAPQQDTNSLSTLVSSTGARVSIQLGNPQYVARMLLDE